MERRRRGRGDGSRYSAAPRSPNPRSLSLRSTPTRPVRGEALPRHTSHTRAPSLLRSPRTRTPLTCHHHSLHGPTLVCPAMVHVRLNERETNPNPHINFITALPMPAAAENEEEPKLLSAIAEQVRPIMKAHGFVVNSLEEVRSACFAVVGMGRTDCATVRVQQGVRGHSSELHGRRNNAERILYVIL